MKALLIISHGSRRDSSNQEVNQLAERVQGLLGDEFELVVSAFLEIASPLIPEGLQHCIDQGATEILILPYFLAAGRHVAEDIPEDIADIRRANPQVSMTLAPHVGAADEMAGFVATQVLAARPSPL
jgi:sirohydrochlorin ferrochelatase